MILISPIATLLPYDYGNSTADGQAQNTDRRPFNRGEGAGATHAVLIGHRTGRIRDRPIDHSAVARQVQYTGATLNPGTRIDEEIECARRQAANIVLALCAGSGRPQNLTRGILYLDRDPTDPALSVLRESANRGAHCLTGR